MGSLCAIYIIRNYQYAFPINEDSEEVKEVKEKRKRERERVRMGGNQFVAVNEINTKCPVCNVLFRHLSI